MNLLKEYDCLSASNKVCIVGISLLDETAEQWELLQTAHSVTRLMAWMHKEEWVPILDHGTLFMGVVNNSRIINVKFRIDSVEYPAMVVDGYWRPQPLPVPLDSVSGTLEVHVESLMNIFEVAWLIIPNTEHQKQFANVEQELLFKF